MGPGEGQICFLLKTVGKSGVKLKLKLKLNFHPSHPQEKGAVEDEDEGEDEDMGFLQVEADLEYQQHTHPAVDEMVVAAAVLGWEGRQWQRRARVEVRMVRRKMKGKVAPRHL